jgi:3-deoxy-manno-octulosonate cytidylyltransferase (CMP-KDO synthetase)
MTAVSFRVVIPARYASTRFPGKALAVLCGKPVVQHVYERAIGSAAHEVVIATDDQRIADVATTFGADVVMTRGYHESGTDRVAEVAQQRKWREDEIVVNVQGDAPLIPSDSIDQVAVLLAQNESADIATLCSPIADLAQFYDVNAVKVVFDHVGRALYFSRAAIPAIAHDSKDGSRDAQKKSGAWLHIGLYAYRVGALNQLTGAVPCDLEIREKLEQLRALWLGMEIRVGVATSEHGPDVDTPEDLAAAESFAALHLNRREMP